MANPKASVLIQLIDKLSKPLAGMRGNVAKFSKTITKMATRIAAAAASVTGLGTVFLSAAGKVEQWRIRFQTMAGSVDEGNKTLEDLTKLAKESPFDMPKVVEGAARLNAMGFEAAELTDRMRMLGDITAGVGTEKMPQLVLAFGQVRSAGKLTGQELRQFNEAGVDLLSGLAENLGKTKAEIKDMVSEGKIGFDDVDEALKKMTSSGGRFFGLMDKLSNTFLGKVSNIKDNLFQMSVAIGDELLPEMTELADKTEEFTSNEKNIVKISNRVKDLVLFVKRLGVFFQNTGDTIHKLWLAAKIDFNNIKLAILDIWVSAEETIRNFVISTIESIAGMANSIIDTVNKVSGFFGKTFDNISLEGDEMYQDLIESSNEWQTESEKDLKKILDENKKLKRELLALEAEKTNRLLDFQQEVTDGAEDAAERRAEAIAKEAEEFNFDLMGMGDATQETSDGMNDAMASFGSIIEKNKEKLYELFDVLALGGTTEGNVLAAEKTFRRNIANINRDFARGEITDEEKFKRLRDTTEDFAEKVQDLKDEALDLSKIKPSDVLDPVKGATRITDANAALRRTDSLFRQIDGNAQSFNDSYQEIVKTTEDREAKEKATAEAVKTQNDEYRNLLDNEAKQLSLIETQRDVSEGERAERLQSLVDQVKGEENIADINEKINNLKGRQRVKDESEAATARRAAERDAERAAANAERSADKQASSLDANIDRINRFEQSKEDLLLRLARDIADLGPGARLHQLTGLSSKLGRDITDLTTDVTRAGIDVGATGSTSDDTLLQGLFNTLSDLNNKLSDLSVNVNVAEVSEGLTKTIDQYQTLNDKGRV